MNIQGSLLGLNCAFRRHLVSWEISESRVLWTREELVVGALEWLRCVASEELLEVILDDHGRGVADLWHVKPSCSAVSLCHLVWKVLYY